MIFLRLNPSRKRMPNHPPTVRGSSSLTPPEIISLKRYGDLLVVVKVGDKVWENQYRNWNFWEYAPFCVLYLELTKHEDECACYLADEWDWAFSKGNKETWKQMGLV
jgi:hypothetical protein